VQLSRQHALQWQAYPHAHFSSNFFMQFINLVRLAPLLAAAILVLLGGLGTIAAAQGPGEPGLLDSVRKLVAEKDPARVARGRSELAKEFSKLGSGTADAEKIAPAVVKELTQASRSKNVSISASVNAALLLGELQYSDKKYDAAATSSLVELVADESVIPAVRVAAFNGLIEQTSTATAGQAVSLLTTFTKLATLEDTTLPTVSRNWILERLLEASPDLVSQLGDDKSAVNPLKDAATTLLSDETRPVNLRVRAAGLLAAMTGSGLTLPAADIQRIAEQTEAVAIAAVQEDWDTIERQKLQEKFSGATPMGGMPAGGPPGDALSVETHYLSEAACLQTSWRLVSLANAAGGLADQLEDEKEKKSLQDRAATLRRLGIAIYEAPGDTSAITAIKELIPEAAAAFEADESGGAATGTFSPFQLR
jgi:hypothetical protein